MGGQQQEMKYIATRDEMVLEEVFACHGTPLENKKKQKSNQVKHLWYLSCVITLCYILLPLP